MFNNLKEFCNKNKYELGTILVYNSYGVKGSRDSYREYDSISVTEILSLLEDPQMKFVKAYYKDKLKEACEYGSRIHKEFENSILNKAQLDSDKKIHLQYKKALLLEGIKPIHSEQTFSLQIEGLPIITGTLDLIGEINNKKYIIDFKTSKGNRNYLTNKYKLQGVFYEKLSGIKGFACLFLNQKGYTLDILSDNDRNYYLDIVNELIEYTKYLYNNGFVNNLKLNN